MTRVNFFGPVDSIFGAELGIADVLVIEALLLALVVLNFVTRKIAHDRHVAQADEGAEAITRFIPHEALNVVLLVGAFYYMTVSYHGGFVLSSLVIGLVLTDFFEFEARKAEARRGVSLGRPKGALAAAAVVLAYAAYQTLFFLIEGPVSAII
ncbi:DUF7313 family protein [Salinibaculum rarum]|uniref:DUF7313 family protein n=1 Tax=Salinibaculum rarum TaxID=3058903 RepID=UPI00265EF954|nr:hypothetical protein [Salinibaculum sp. KK48]